MKENPHPFVDAVRRAQKKCIAKAEAEAERTESRLIREDRQTPVRTTKAAEKKRQKKRELLREDFIYLHGVARIIERLASELPRMDK